jgi:hypothetical protein
VAIKHAKVLEKLKENVGKCGKTGSFKEAIIDAGYSKSYAENGNLLKTKTWEELMEQYLKEEEILEAEKNQMTAKRLYDYTFPKSLTDEQIKEDIESHTGCKLVRIVRGEKVAQAFFYTPDNAAIGKSLDRIYKLKKKYDNTLTIKGNISKLSAEELEAAIAREISEALGTIAGEGEA